MNNPNGEVYEGPLLHKYADPSFQETLLQKEGERFESSEDPHLCLQFEILNPVRSIFLRWEIFILLRASSITWYDTLRSRTDMVASLARVTRPTDLGG